MENENKIEQAREKAVEKAVKYLFCAGQSNEAERLVLWSKLHPDMGGWGYLVIKDFLARFYDETRASPPPREWVSVDSEGFPKFGELVVVRRDCGDSYPTYLTTWDESEEKYAAMNSITHYFRVPPFTGGESK